MSVIAEQVSEVQNCGRNTFPDLQPSAGPGTAFSCKNFALEEHSPIDMKVSPLTVECGTATCSNRGCIFFYINKRCKPPAYVSPALPLAE